MREVDFPFFLPSPGRVTHSYKCLMGAYKDLHVHGELAKNWKTMLNSKALEEKPSFREKSEKLTLEGADMSNLLACNNILSESLPLFLFEGRHSATVNLLIRWEQIYL